MRFAEYASPLIGMAYSASGGVRRRRNQELEPVVPDFALYPAGKVLLSCIPYLPASVALAWTYEKAGTIWASISLHAIVNALSFGLLQLNF